MGEKEKYTGSHVVVVKTRGIIFYPTVPLLNLLCHSQGGQSILTRLGGMGRVKRRRNRGRILYNQPCNRAVQIVILNTPPAWDCSEMYTKPRGRRR